jgi:hypothetical protein
MGIPIDVRQNAVMALNYNFFRAEKVKCGLSLRNTSSGIYPET